MTDYTWDIGNTGQMRIRDTGSTVEFWVTANNAGTSMYSIPWGYTVNGTTDNSNTFSYAQGEGWKRIGAWNVTTDQTVTFRLYDTGTWAMGSGGTHSVTVERTSAPSAPGPWVIEQIFNTSVQGDVDGMDTGGLALDEVQVRYSLSSTAVSNWYYDPGLDGYGTIGALNPGTTYYFWVRSHNSKGWSPWSTRTSAKTHTVPPAPSTPVLSNIRQSALHSFYSGNGDGGSVILEWQTAYGYNSSTPEFFVTGFNLDLVNLTPGATVYVWARGRNTYGWGPWSARASATLPASSYVDVSGVKKRAVPYVKVAGVWKPAEGYVKIAGMWKPTA